MGQGLAWRGMHAQSCLTLCDPMDCSPPGSSVPGIFQAGILEWVAISYYRGSSPLRSLLHWQADSEPPGKPFHGSGTDLGPL